MSKTILIVDDEDDARAIAVLALQMKTDWMLLQARSGKEAIEIALDKMPDLILLDMMMPEMDGKATLQTLKTTPKTASIPTILMTAKVQPIEQTGIEPEQVAAIFTKPFRPLTLADEIRKVLNW